jgi:hypothetical protein
MQVVKARGAAMAAAAAVPPGGRAHGMLSVVGLGDGDIERLCEDARQQLGGDTVCQLANYLFPQVRSNSIIHHDDRHVASALLSLASYVTVSGCVRKQGSSWGRHSVPAGQLPLPSGVWGCAAGARTFDGL